MAGQFAFKRTGDADYPRYLKVLLQGPPKSGKTTFITTAPNVVIASCEAGLMSIAHLDVPFVEIDGTEKLQQLEMILRDDSLRAAAAKQLELPKIETVAIDTLDAWQEMLKKEIMAENRRTVFQRDDWGTLKERMAVIMKRFTTLPLNVIFTVHTTTTQDDEQKLIYAPALQGSIKDEIAGYVDFSLLSFRQRETASNGTPRIAYYLKNEGDQKNPHLGNRAAGRVPETCAPDFRVLHNAVFSAVKPSTNRSPAKVIKEAADVDAPSAEEVAQIVSHPAPAAAVDAPKVPSGVPADNPNAPINASGISMLTKSYLEHGLVLPANIREWTLAKGRDVAKYFIAWKTDKVAGVDGTTRDDLIEYLKAMDAFNGEMDGVSVGTEKVTKPAKTPKPAAEQAPAEAAGSVATEVKTEAGQTEEGALALVEEQLGAVVIGREVGKDTACETCGKPVDDPDIANLALMKFKRPLCVKDYRAAIQEARK
jgi:hypothetical protein